MLSFPVFVATYSRRASTPPHLCGPGALCVEIPLPRSPLICCDHTVLILWEDPGLYGTPSGSLSTIALSPLPATSMDLPASVANKRLMAKLNLLDATLTENTGGGLRPLQRATRRSYLAAALKPFPFMLLRTLLHRAKSQPLYFQAFPHSLPQNTRGGGTSSFSIEAPSQLWAGTFPSVPLRRKAFGATICKGTGFLHHPGKQLRSPRCLRLRERTSGTVRRSSRFTPTRSGSQVVPGYNVLTQ